MSVAEFAAVDCAGGCDGWSIVQESGPGPGGDMPGLRHTYLDHQCDRGEEDAC